MTPYTNDDIATLSTEIRWVTPGEARALRAACHFDRQRTIRAEHVKRLGEEMKHGWFLAGTPIWLCVLPDKSMLIVNGNHTLEAVADGEFPVPITFVYQQVDDIDEVARVYACFDIQRTRTWGQAAKAVGVDVGLFEAGKTISAVGMIQANFAPATYAVGSLSRSARFALVEEYRGAANLLRDAMVGAPGVNQSMVLRAAIFSVALVTARYQPSAAEEFWGRMAMDDGLRANDPRKALLRYMINNPGHGADRRREQSIAAASAWNAYFEGRPLSYMKPGLTQIFQIAGTPWSKGGAEGPKQVVRKPRLAQRVTEPTSSELVTGVSVNGRGESIPVVLHRS